MEIEVVRGARDSRQASSVADALTSISLIRSGSLRKSSCIHTDALNPVSLVFESSPGESAAE